MDDRYTAGHKRKSSHSNQEEWQIKEDNMRSHEHEQEQVKMKFRILKESIKNLPFAFPMFPPGADVLGEIRARLR